MTRGKAGARELRTLKEALETDALNRRMRAEADRSRKQVNTRDFKWLDHQLTSLTKQLGSALTILKRYNEHPALEYYGIEPLDPKTSVADLLTAARRALGNDLEAVQGLAGIAKETWPSRSDLRRLEDKAMHAMVRGGVSRNVAARTVAEVAGKDSPSPILKRYRAARRGVAK